MFNKKPRRNFRQRKNSSSEDEDQQKTSGEAEESDKAAPEHVNKPLRAAQGRGISCSSKREATPPRPGSSEEEDRRTEDVAEERHEGIDETKKKAKSMLSFSEDREAGESTFRLKKSSDKAVLFQVRRKKEIPAAKTSYSKASGDGGALSTNSPRRDDGNQSSPPSVNHDDDDDDDDDDKNSDDDDSDNGKDEDTDSSEASSRSLCSNSTSNSSHTAVKKVVIPKAAEIEAARRRRRAARAQKDFISLGRDGHSSAGSTPDHYSRDDEDERDDGDDDEPDDHERRIAFAPGFKSVKERIAEKLGESDGSLSGTDAEEQELWEETQIGKGVKRRPGELSPSGSESSNYSSSSFKNYKGRQKRSAGARMPKTLPEITVSMVKRRITGKLESLKEVHRARQAELRRMESDVDSAKTSLETLEEHSSENQLKFYRSMTLYIHNLAECLREKIVEINSLELELHTLLSDQMEALLAQRREKVQEQAERLQQLSNNSDEQSGGSANGAETQCEVDLNVKTEEDFISEDTQPSAEEEEQLQKKIDDILSRSQAVFSDVQDDFSNVKKILSRFEEWRSSYSDSYHSAYISLCLPKLLSPIIRHQLLTWNPLKDTSGDFENLPWFTGVETFCHGHGHEELDQTDRQTLSNVIERTVLPKMTAYVELVWDPLSYQQSACLTAVCHKLKEDYAIFEGERSKPVQTLMEAVVCRLRSCVDEDIFIPLYPKKVLEDKSSPQRLFRDQQFWTAVKLLGNMGKWDSLLPESVLKELMLDKLLSRYLTITLCSQTLSKSDIDACKKIADSLPISWFKGETACLPQLQNFRNYIVQKVHTICKEEPPEGPKTRSAVVEALKVLSRIRCHDAILTLANKYRYEDAIYSHQLLNQDAE